MIKFTKKLSIVVSFLTILSGQYSAFASSDAVDQVTMQTPVGPVLKPNKMQIFTFAAMDEKTDPGNLRLVCKEWKCIIDGLVDRKDNTRSYAKQHLIWQKIMRLSYAGMGHEDEWERILNAELIYTPDTSIKLGKISDLFNPFADAFDISKCGDVSKKLHLRMGLRKGRRVENKGMTEIHFTPRSMVVHQLGSNSTAYLAYTIADWPEENLIAPIFTWWAWDISKFESNHCADFKILSTMNLGDIYKHQTTGAMNMMAYIDKPLRAELEQGLFMFRFLNLPKDY